VTIAPAGPLKLFFRQIAQHQPAWELTIYYGPANGGATWNIYHVSLQSAGILSIYRRLNAGQQKEKLWAHLTILFVNAFVRQTVGPYLVLESHRL